MHAIRIASRRKNAKLFQPTDRFSSRADDTGPFPYRDMFQVAVGAPAHPQSSKDVPTQNGALPENYQRVGKLRIASDRVHHGVADNRVRASFGNPLVQFLISKGLTTYASLRPISKHQYC